MSIARASIAVLRQTTRSLVASLTKRREGPRERDSRTDAPAREKPDGTADPLHYESARAARLDTVDSNSAAQVLDTRDDQEDATPDDPSEHRPANVDAQLLDWSYNGRRLSEVGGRMVLPVNEDPRQQGNIEAMQTVGGDLVLASEGVDVWIQTDSPVTLEGGC